MRAFLNPTQIDPDRSVAEGRFQTVSCQIGSGPPEGGPGLPNCLRERIYATWTAISGKKCGISEAADSGESDAWTALFWMFAP